VLQSSPSAKLQNRETGRWLASHDLPVTPLGNWELRLTPWNNGIKSTVRVLRPCSTKRKSILPTSQRLQRCLLKPKPSFVPPREQSQKRTTDSNRLRKTSRRSLVTRKSYACRPTSPWRHGPSSNTKRQNISNALWQKPVLFMRAWQTWCVHWLSCSQTSPHHLVIGAARGVGTSFHASASRSPKREEAFELLERAPKPAQFSAARFTQPSALGTTLSGEDNSRV